jgi:hypothetical protein
MTDPPKVSYHWQTAGSAFPWRQLILDVLVPITLFYILHRLGQPLMGALLAIGWSISFLAVTYGR